MSSKGSAHLLRETLTLLQLGTKISYLMLVSQAVSYVEHPCVFPPEANCTCFLYCHSTAMQPRPFECEFSR